MIKSLEHLKVEIDKGQQFELYNSFTEKWNVVLAKRMTVRNVRSAIDNKFLRVKQVRS